ncbi:anti-sigma factor [Streptomyces sp. DSM 41014]|uniref:Regulator of SigK n=1 Tax=Streptomyces hintoniae TaxID=3075521 RepID=A0ABU2UXS7_9ACTN|nr:MULTISPECIES: anti-sigma factor [unclassified Streptomyces]MDH6699456.1 anti-sigma factor RsiW [Streptomyces sp. MAA16]MDT0477676.1 anti-sigma factor [Streptomyces sp. DSM 41014]
MITADLHLLTGAYAVDALSDDERAAFERHLGDCEGCAQETAELTATAARLGLAVTETPRPALREQVLRSITTVRQESPGGPVATRTATTASRNRALSRWALAACFAAAAAFGGTAIWQHQRAEDALGRATRAEQAADTVTSVLSAPDARTRAATLADGATGAVVVSHSRDKAVFVVSGMARPPSGKVYQLWFDDAGTMRSAGLMKPGAGDQTVLLDGAVDGASGMGITVEPAGGSKQPTSAPIALMDFPA